MTGTQFVAGNGTERRIKLKYYYRVTRNWKAEMNLRTPRLLPGLSEGGGRNFFRFFPEAS